MILFPFENVSFTCRLSGKRSENNFLEQRKYEVLEIFPEVAQEYMKSNEYVEDVLYPGYFSSPIGVTIKNNISFVTIKQLKA